MSIGKMNKKARIVRLVETKDSEGFISKEEELVASIRCAIEGRHGSEKWANLASFSEATELFTFRKIPNVTISTDMFIVYDNIYYDILSSEAIHGRGMYVEVLAKRNESSDGKS